MSEAVRTNITRINRLRTEKGWSSFREMEAATGISHATLCRTENGKEPSLLNALHIAKALNCRVEDLWKIAKR